MHISGLARFLLNQTRMSRVAWDCRIRPWLERVFSSCPPIIGDEKEMGRYERRHVR